MKRCINGLDTNPTKKRKIDVNQPKNVIQKLFTHPNDYEAYKNIYQTLCNVLQLDDINILSQIAIFATGDIGTCNLCNVEILELQSDSFKSNYIRNRGKDGTHTWISEYIYCSNCANNVADDGKQPSDYGANDIFFHCESSKCTPGYYPKPLIEECDAGNSVTSYEDIHLICKECIVNIPLSQCYDCERYFDGGDGRVNFGFIYSEKCNVCKQMICPICSGQATHPDATPDSLLGIKCDECGEHIPCINCARNKSCGDCDSWICDSCYEDHDCGFGEYFGMGI